MNKLILVTVLTLSSLVSFAHGSRVRSDAELQCIADGLESYNSDIYYGLSMDDVRELLLIPKTEGRYSLIQHYAKECAKAYRHGR